MKGNRIEPRGHAGLWLSLGLVATVAVLVGLAVGFETLRGICEEPCVITDMAEQVEIVSGKMVKPDVLAESFGLRPGANLARIDFEERRAEILRKIPTLKAVTVTRRLPNRVRICAEERTPVTRLSTVGRKSPTGRVADSEGVVFSCARGTQALPVIREPRLSATGVGQPLKGRSRAALDLVLACREPEFADFGLLEVDTSKPDFLLATLGDYSRLKICWEDMDEATPAARAALAVRLTGLGKAIRSRCEGLRAVIWNATLPDYVYADTQEKL